MLAYLSLIQQLLSLGGGRRHSHITGINLNVAGLGAMIFGLAAAFGAVIFAMIALEGWLAMVITSPYAEPIAWLCVAGITLVIAGVAITVGKESKRDGLISFAYAAPKPTPNSYADKGSDKIHVNGTDHKASFDESFVKNMTEEFATHIEDHPLTAVVLAGLAGMAAGKSMSD